jgi:hypothetical protein
MPFGVLVCAIGAIARYRENCFEAQQATTAAQPAIRPTPIQAASYFLAGANMRMWSLAGCVFSEDGPGVSSSTALAETAGDQSADDAKRSSIAGEARSARPLHGQAAGHPGRLLPARGEPARQAVAGAQRHGRGHGTADDEDPHVPRSTSAVRTGCPAAARGPSVSAVAGSVGSERTPRRCDVVTMQKNSARQPALLCAWHAQRRNACIRPGSGRTRSGRTGTLPRLSRSLPWRSLLRSPLASAWPCPHHRSKASMPGHGLSETAAQAYAWLFEARVRAGVRQGRCDRHRIAPGRQFPARSADLDDLARALRPAHSLPCAG